MDYQNLENQLQAQLKQYLKKSGIEINNQNIKKKESQNEEYQYLMREFKKYKEE